MVPIDKDLIDEKILNKNEKKWLNNYHREVFRNLKGLMNRSEIIELKKRAQLFKIFSHSFSVIIFMPRVLA